MVIDTSAVVALLFNEPEAVEFEGYICTATVRLMSAATYLEASIVIQRRFGDMGEREFDLLIHKAGIEIVAFTSEQAEVARKAYRDYGKGRHKAGLNYGDCFSYALSKISGEPLLFKGEDFSQTDIQACR